MALELKYHHLLLVFYLSLLPFFTSAQTYKNFSLGSSITAQPDNNNYLTSPSGEFAFGFQKIEENGFLLAIWFNKIPEKTIVWSANGQKLAPQGSKIVLSQDGFFALNDPNGNKIWSADSSGSGTSYAAMLDTGKLVLADKSSQYLWQSFDQPTDTILPGQVLNQPVKLVSRYLEMNYSNGRFQFVLKNDGSYGLYTSNFPLDSTNSAYWPQASGSGFSLVFNQSGYIYLVAKNGSILQTISENAPSTQDFYERAILEYDGVFRHYVYPKSSSSNTGSWKKAWSTVSYIPENICMSITEQTGSGACGLNSYCTIDGGRKNCQCPSGYSFIDQGDVMKGCKQDFDSQSCDETSSETDPFDFYGMENTDWPFSDYEHFQSVSEDWCRQVCLVDCFCDVAIFRNGDCWKKRLPLSNGRQDSSVGGKALIKTRKDNSTLKSEGPVKDNDHSRLIITGSVLLSSSVFLNLFLLVGGSLVVYRFGYRNSKVNEPSQFIAGMWLRSFTYDELRKATDGFKEELGRGAYSTVYKGVLLDLTGNNIAVKKLNNMVKDSEQEFKTEVSAFGRTNHRNLVQLLGFCNEGEHRMLIYEFMRKGSLASFLFGTERPTWSQRIQIALGIARGILYLHEECSSQIIHCDIKPQNVLLDDSFTAKISDFGLAKLLKIDQNGTTTMIRGTKGYVAPEWFRNMPITIKVDVYSYGVLLLEIICCRRSFEANVENENQMVLTDWAYDCFQERKLDLLVEDDMEALDDMKNVEKYVMIALWCIQEDPSLRPTMKKVLQMLEGSVGVPMPPNLTSFTSSL